MRLDVVGTNVLVGGFEQASSSSNIGWLVMTTPPPYVGATPPKIAGKQIPFSTAIRLAGGIVQPHPFLVYQFGGGQVQADFYENV